MKTFRKLLALAFGPVLLTVAVVFFLAFELTETTVRTEIDQLAGTKLSDETRHLRDVFSQTQSSLRLLGVSPLIQKGDPATIVPQLKLWTRHFPQAVEALYYNTPSGDVYGSDDSTFNVSDRYYFPQIQQGQTVITKVIPSRASGSPVILVLVPVISPQTGERTGAIGATVLVRNIVGHISSIDPGFRAHAVLIDESGQPVSSRSYGKHRDEEVKRALKSMGSANSGKQRIRLTSTGGTVYFQTIQGTQWRLAFIYDDAEIFFTRRLVRNTLLLVLALCLPFILLAAWRVKKDLTEPMEALAASEERWRSLVQNAPFIIMTIDAHGTVLFINQVAPGYKREEVIGSSVFSYVQKEQLAVMRQGIGSVFGEGNTQSYEISVLHPDNTTHWYANTLSPIYEEGKINKAILVTFDITDRHLAKEKAAESERRFRGIFNQAFQFIGLLSPAGHVLEANGAALDFIGKTVDDVRGKPFWETPWWTHSDEAQTHLKAALTQAARGEFVHFETTHQSHAGVLHVFDFSLKPVFDDGGKLLWLIAEGHDITLLKQTVDALRRSETLFRSIVDDQTEMIVRWKPDGTRTFVNEAYCRMYGQTREQLIGTAFFDLISPQDVATVKQKIASLSPRNPILTNAHRCLLPDGSISWQEWTDHAHFDNKGNILDIQSVGRDITERIRHELAQKEYEGNLTALVENIPGATWSVDRQYRYITFNRLFRRGVEIALGQKPKIGSDIHNGLPPEVAAFWQAQFDRALGGEQFTLEYPLKVRQTIRHFEISFNPIRTGEEITGVTVLSLDVTARKKTDDALRLQSLVLESMAEGVGLSDEAGRIIYTNPAEERMFGGQRGGLLGAHVTDLLAYSSEEASRIQEEINAEVRRTGRCAREVLNRRKDGGTFYSQVAFSILERAGKQHVIWMREDITERRKLEAQLRQAQKMESIGQLAGGVAHDFNNILTVIQGHAGVLQLFGDLHTEASDAASEIVKASDRAASLVKQLLTFSRQQVMQQKELDLSALVTDVARMLRRLLGEQITLTVEPQPPLPLIKADPAMMQQIVLNLAVNARDAMPGGGSLAIRLRSEHRTAPDEAADGRTGRYICLEVVDTGTGIEPGNLSRIYDPFFTTKEVGKGTGLGLSTVYGIVQQHKGWIEVESELGRGTTFRIYLPALEKTVLPVSEIIKEHFKDARGSETILLVEDEAPLRALVRNILTQFGYRVLSAQTGAEALELWSEHEADVALLLTDLVMPDGMSGIELASLLSREKPGLKIIYSSGYSAEMAAQQNQLTPHGAFLSKPYGPQQLAETVRSVLDQP
ncbi:MAG TPA: PAS domain S-box protein [Verrucomicrobiae bacterium]